MCRLYNCEHLLRPIIDFQPEAKSPPLAPKHLVTAQSGKPNSRRGGPDVASSGSAMNTRSSRRNQGADGSDVDTLSVRGSDDGSMTPSPSEASSSSRTPSPIRSTPEQLPIMSNGVDDDLQSPPPEPPSRKRKQRPAHDEYDVDHEIMSGNSVQDPSMGINVDGSRFIAFNRLLLFCQLSYLSAETWLTVVLGRGTRLNV